MKFNTKIKIFDTLKYVFFITVISIFLAFTVKSFQKKIYSITSSFNEIKISPIKDSIHLETLQDSLNYIQFINEIGTSRDTIINEIKNLQNQFLLFILILLLFIIIICCIVKKNNNKNTMNIVNGLKGINQGITNIKLEKTSSANMNKIINAFNKTSENLTNNETNDSQEVSSIWVNLSRTLAHEIKNPLTPIQLAIQRLELKYNKDKNELYDYFPKANNIIKSEIENLLNISKKFSSYAKVITAEKIIFNPKSVLDKIICSYEQDYSFKLNIKNNENVYFDIDHFYQITTNLIQNAIDASNHDSHIDISLRKNKDKLIFEIKDYGCGINKNDINKIFNPYFTKKNNGSGLGLALVKKFILANDSMIYVLSEEKIGTKFWFSMDIIKD